MRLMLAMFCLLACGNAAWAQNGISNQRDASGNLLRDGGATSPRSVNPGAVNNGPVRNVPTQPTTNNTSTAKGAVR
ncbi:MAG: putative exported protein of unknown function [Bradyrhizobium sp.]|nr:putative exported protein of unknown function [Bradyrhizobium sp.]